MDEKLAEVGMEQWFSSYGAITAERILSRYQITIPHQDLAQALKNPGSFFHFLLQVPLNNVLNGIIFQQAHDYHQYVQKLYVDYLLSSESNKSEEEQGAGTRDLLEEEREALILSGEDFNKKQIEHDALIAKTQGTLIKLTKEWNLALEAAVKDISTRLKNQVPELKKSQIRAAIHSALIQSDFTKIESSSDLLLFIDKLIAALPITSSPELKEEIAQDLSQFLEITLSFNYPIPDFLDLIRSMRDDALSFRHQFYEIVLRVVSLIKLLPDYKIDPVQDAINRAALYFDQTLGN